MVFDQFPYKIYASVLLFDNKIVMWKIGPDYWRHPGLISVRSKLPGHILDGKIEYTSFEVKDDFEHQRVFDWDSRLWFKNWEMHDQYVGGKPY